MNLSNGFEINLVLLALIAAPLFISLIPLQRLQQRLKLECPHCHLPLFKPRVQQFVFDTECVQSAKRGSFMKPNTVHDVYEFVYEQ
jgi:hypothetical protein